MTTTRQLAILGGSPAFEPDKLDVQAPQLPLAELSDGSWGRYDGRHGQQLIAALQQLLQVDHAYPCCSGTFAVELALRMLKVGPGDEVLLAAYDFGGNFRAIEAVGATPVLVDIVPQSWHLDPQQLSTAASPHVKAILVSHLHGALAPMRKLAEIARERNWRIVEDACQATGALIDGRRAGAWGDVGTLSFGGSKLLTAGRGGCVVTNDATLLQRAKVYCEKGNHAFPLSELQAAVLVPQLAQLEQHNARRLHAVHRLCERFASSTATGEMRLVPCPPPALHDAPAYYKLGCQIVVNADDANFSRTQQLRAALIAALQAEGIEIDAGFRGFASRGVNRCRKVGELPHARAAAAGTLVLHHRMLLLDDELLDRLAQTLAEVAQYLCTTR